MKKLFAFIAFCAYILGALGGFGYAVYGGSWPIAIAIVILALMAWPQFENAWKEMND